ncbi:MAG: benzylsuccinate synthase gamma subunit family protein [Bacillota bacterium]
MPGKCDACKNFVKTEDDEKGLCVQEKVTLKGGCFWSSRPAKTGEGGCDEFEARDSKKS